MFRRESADRQGNGRHVHVRVASCGTRHIDTLDPKGRGDGGKTAGSYYNAIKTAVPGVQVTEHLPKVAERMDRIALLRGMSHQFSDHTRAVDLEDTRRLPTGTVVYPSIGSIVSHELGGFDPKAPAYVVVGEPMQPRGPGFLGGKSNYIYVTDTQAGPEGLRRSRDLTSDEYNARIRGSARDSPRLIWKPVTVRRK